MSALTEGFLGALRFGRRRHGFVPLIVLAVTGLAAACSSAGDGSATSSSADTTSTSGVDPGDTVAQSATCDQAAGCIRADLVQVVDTLDYFATALDVTYTGQVKYMAYRIDGVTGDTPEINVLVDRGTSDPEVWLLDSEFGIVGFNDNRDSTTTESRLDVTIPRTGSQKFFIAFREKTGKVAHFDVALTGGSGPGNVEPIDYPSTRLAQTDIDNGVYTSDQLFAYGDFLFNFEFTLNEGLGNALSPPLAGPNPPPNARRIHNGKFGGPDGTHCNECHGVGGNDGAGTNAQNLLQDGDGVNLSSALVRNAPALLGSGYKQQLAIEMTADLQGQLAAAVSAAATGSAQTVNLTSKGISFGSVVVAPTGVVDFTGLQGVDKDLVIKPFGWKGRTAVLRRFVEGGFQVHFGMASQALVAQNCKTPIPNTVGNGPDCTDPDSDGVVDEILESQLTAMALYPALLQAPARVNPTDPTALARAQNGETLFNQVGCNSCHTVFLNLANPVHEEKPDLSGGPAFTIDLTVDGQIPRLSRRSDGSVNVFMWSDLKRHDMGASLADAHDTFDGAVPARLWITTPLWGVAGTAPYMHDGRAPTLQDAIAEHDGEGATSRDAYLALVPDSQAQVIEFLQTLSRDPGHTDD